MPSPARLALSLAFAAIGCSHPRAATPAPPPVGIEFALYLPASALAVGSELVVTLGDPPGGGCGKYDAMEDLQVAPCPQMPDRRETVVLTVPAPGQPLLVRSTGLAIGHAYTLTINGIAADGCNHVSGSRSGTVAATSVILRDLALVATHVECPT